MPLSCFFCGAACCFLYLFFLQLMPSWCWSDAVICGASIAMNVFLQNECSKEGRLLFNLDEESEKRRTKLGFDGFVSNGGIFCYGNCKVDGMERQVLQADFETRWSPPLPFFRYLADKFPDLRFYFKYEIEDNEKVGWMLLPSSDSAFRYVPDNTLSLPYVVVFQDEAPLDKYSLVKDLISNTGGSISFEYSFILTGFAANMTEKVAFDVARHVCVKDVIGS